MALEATLKSVESLLRDVVSHQLEAAIETKLDGVKSDVDKMGAHSSKLFGMLQTKIDNLVRQMHAVEEGQKKTNKLLQDLLKSAAKSEAVERPSAEQRLKVASTMSATINQALKMEERQVADAAEADQGGSGENGSDNGRPMMNYYARQMNEDRWAHNVLLVGDEHWNCLRTADDDVAKEVKRLESESKLNFRVASKPGETIERLYDVIRGKLLFAVPPRVQKVVVSVGAKDLLDPQLMTLSQGSLGDVRKNNSAYLTPKATALREMAAYLLNQKKTVVLLLPPIGEDRIEISQQWVEVLLAVVAPLVSSYRQFRVINLPELMMKTMADYVNHDDYLNLWLSRDAPEGEEDGKRRLLTGYGARRLFDQLKRAIIARPYDPDFTAPSKELVSCVRCLRKHPGGEATCKSRDKMCRRCNRIGHYVQIHDVEDPDMKQAIAEALGSDIFDLTVPMAEAVVVVPAPASATAAADHPRELLKAAVRNGSSKSSNNDPDQVVPPKKAKKTAGTGANMEPLNAPAWKKNSRLPKDYYALS